ncbi:methanogenesis marker 6 protein [Methanothermococcus okinawensis]|uniref:Methanogenesis marker protein 6 n=1 Tax=Methanothermococcus okinawensis (strain DSM 14208 / JCM 11175 / IH1) TaxID=647113 RepID=F8AJM6_METOI|nr:methanogenesis marker 6 protein [Methanothermococcus okinawensis]AEH07214.1 methanogenesis marker protein 6 [Methanothermococcus okinawensis IH1]
MKTKVIVLAEDANTSPSKLFRYLNSLNYDIKVKETCFGAYIEGEDELVDKIADMVRNLEKNKIFCKDRGFPIWDKRRCRAFRKGGPREGFHQLEAEQKALELISKGLEEVEKGELNIDEIDRKYNSILEKNKKISIDEFKKIAEAVK